MSKELINQLLPEDTNFGIVSQILIAEGLSLEKRFTTGHSGCFVGKATDAEGKDLVIKIPLDDKSQEEIHENIQGYIALQQQGVPELLPDTIRIRSLNGRDYLITTYLGNDFAYRAQNEPNPEALYQELASQLLPIYKKTLKENSIDADTFLHFIENLLKRNFVGYITSSGIVNEEEAKDLLNFDVYQLVTDKSCFAVFDFTPEDVYLTEKGIKYPDPKQLISGNPIIDLACFAGVSRDVYKLPGSEEGYKILYDLAMHEVAPLLGLSENQAQRIFYLGRAVQYSLSSRFRIENEREKASVYARKSIEYLSLVTQKDDMQKR